MGKKIKEERAQKREKYSDKITREKRRFKLIAVGIIAGVAIVLGITGYIFYENTFGGNMNVPGAPSGAGRLGDEHEHASMNVIIFGDKFDFSTNAYQVKNRYIHFENNNGETIHRHASGVTLGFLFESLNIGFDDSCFTFPDKREFCTNDQYSLKFYVNHQNVPSLQDYVLEDNDRILISYGNENSTKIDEQLARVDSILIDK
ncbi:MAG: protein-disulfide isomerase [Nitrosopumilaceae archaeon]